MNTLQKINWILLVSASPLFSQSPDDLQKADAFFQKGLNAHQQASLDDAIGYYSAALNRSAHHSGALYNRAMAYFSKNQFSRAAVDLDAYLLIFPLDRDALERRGYVAFLQKQFADADKFYSRAIEIAQSARLFTNRGIARLEAGNPEQAIQDFQAALQIDENIVEAWQGAGNAWMQLHDFAKAETIFRQAIQRGNNDPAVLFNLAISLGKLGDFQQAKSLLDNIISQRNDPAALAQRAFCAFKIGDFQQAQADATQAHLLDVRLTYPYHTLGLLSIREKNWLEAEQFFSEGLSWNENDANLLAARGQARYFLKNYQDALSDLNLAVQLDPLVGETFYSRASVHLMLGERVRACQDYQNALRLGFEPFTDEDGSSFCECVSGAMEPKK